MKNKILVAALRECETKDDLESTFSKYDVSSFTDKTAYLDECMYSPQSFYSNTYTEEQLYFLAVEIFLTKVWKLNELYEKAGM